ncbi:MAG TPA: hypothetical protein DCY00_03490 [Actinobacteria bacterium]|nr:hypothetical protein [Actinomycetota bacterium]
MEKTIEILIICIAFIIAIGLLTLHIVKSIKNKSACYSCSFYKSCKSTGIKVNYNNNINCKSSKQKGALIE